MFLKTFLLIRLNIWFIMFSQSFILFYFHYFILFILLYIFIFLFFMILLVDYKKYVIISKVILFIQLIINDIF